MEKTYFFHRHPKLTLISVVVIFLSLMWAVAELLLKPRIEKAHVNYNAVTSLTYKDDGNSSEAGLFPETEFRNNGDGVRQVSSMSYQINHQFLGYSHPRDVTVQVKKIFDGKTFIDVTYTFDQHRRRVTPVSNPENRSVNALFFGCSFMMGDSLQDNQTMPYYFSEKLNQVRSYNYAIGGTGAPSMLYQIENRDLEFEVGKAEKNIAVYLYADSHVQRSNIDLFRSQWLVDSPYYEWTGSELIQHQSFAHAKPFIYKFYEILTSSNVMAPFIEDINPWVNHLSEEESDRQFVEIIKRAKNSFAKKLPNAEFYVAVFPAIDEKELARIEPMLKKARIHVIRLHLPEKEDFKIHEKESHFNEIANQKMVEILVDEIKL